MMFGIRQKLTLAFGGVLLILAMVGTVSGLFLTGFSTTLEKLFRENYDSMVYGQNLKGTISDLQNIIVRTNLEGSATQDSGAILDLVGQFQSSLDLEKKNITIPGEGEVVEKLEKAWKSYLGSLLVITKDATVSKLELQKVYTKTSLDFSEIKRLSAQIIEMNYANIISIDGQIKQKTLFARSVMIVLILSALALSSILFMVLARSVLRPLQVLTQSVREIERGHLDLTVNIKSKDELGQLAEAFNAMAAQLREFRKSARAKLFRIQKTTQLALNTFPDAIAIVNTDGKIELANESAQRHFHLAAGEDLAKVELLELWEIFQKVNGDLKPVTPKSYANSIQIFVEGKEHFFLPQGVPILSDDKHLTGVTLVLTDVTDLRRIDEMKSDLLSVVSHELKTPLTSIRMATHLLLDERIGSLNPKQEELLVTARDDAERLNSIVERLLDIGRIESGRALMEVKPILPDLLVSEALERFSATFRDRGVSLTSALEGPLPEVLADTSRISHVFANLLDNALKYTKNGGKVSVSAKQQDDKVLFAVADTGVGIAPEEQRRIFEKFYRIPGQSPEVKGAGLGLAIAREIIEAHGGTLTVTSKLGEGSAFAFTLKISTPA